MNASKKNEPRKVNPVPVALLAAIIAGLVVGYVSFLFGGTIGFVIGFIVGALIASRTTLMVIKAREQKQ